MEAIRRLVSGNRRRLIEGNYSLDLSYITPNIIAMSYPSQGFESFYRNSITQVRSPPNSDCFRYRNS